MEAVQNTTQKAARGFCMWTVCSSALPSVICLPLTHSFSSTSGFGYNPWSPACSPGVCGRNWHAAVRAWAGFPFHDDGVPDGTLAQQSPLLQQWEMGFSFQRPSEQLWVSKNSCSSFMSRKAGQICRDSYLCGSSGFRSLLKDRVYQVEAAAVSVLVPICYVGGA